MTDVTPVRIGGDLVTTDDEIVISSPYDGHEVGRVPACGKPEVDRAVAVARARLLAAADGSGAFTAAERAAVLDRAAALLDERAEQFARIIAEEAAKPIRTALVEARRAVDTFRFERGRGPRPSRAMSSRWRPARRAPARSASRCGCRSAWWGPSARSTSRSTWWRTRWRRRSPRAAPSCSSRRARHPCRRSRLAALLLDECGLPAGWFNVVTGSGRAVGDPLVDNDDVAMITFTGSPEVGWGIRARAARKKVNLELGNNTPVIVEGDADWRTAAAKLKVAGFSHAGQSCISSQRLYVHRSIVDDFVAALVDEVGALAVGDPLDEATDVSALISAGETERVSSWIGEAVAGGAKVAIGGEVGDDGVLRPTVLTGVTPDMRVCRDEVFGPVVAVTAYDDLDEALALANDTRYGLQAGIFTSRLDAALAAARRLDFGGVVVNEVPTWRADQQPYGGVRDSGNTREGPHYAVREMTELRLVVLQT